MVDATNSTQAKPLTFSDAMIATRLQLWVSWRLLVACWRGALFGGATVSTKATTHGNVNVATVNVNRQELLLTYESGKRVTIIVEVVT